MDPAPAPAPTQVSPTLDIDVYGLADAPTLSDAIRHLPQPALWPPTLSDAIRRSEIYDPTLPNLDPTLKKIRFRREAAPLKERGKRGGEGERRREGEGGRGAQAWRTLPDAPRRSRNIV